MPSHFYTTSAAERQNAITNLRFTDEGTACFVHGSPAPGPAPLYRSVEGSGAHFYTMSIDERDNATNNLGHKGEGITGYIYAAPQAGFVPLYRAYNPTIDDHFYTASLSEHQNAVQHLGYADEGITGYLSATQVAGTVPLYRMVKTTHFYTANAAEHQNAIQNLGYTDEGITGYLYPLPPPGVAPLYRAIAKTSSHFYTMSIDERDDATFNLGYRAEGIACYIFAAPQAGQVPLYRAYNSTFDDHFYTDNLAEHQNAVQHLGYSDEGITGYVAAATAANLIPLYRLLSPGNILSLIFNMQPQQESEWCWSASTCSITLFYDPHSPWTQCTLVNKRRHRTDCCANGSSKDCNQPDYPNKALPITGHFASTKSGAMKINDIVTQINAFHPISINIQWKGGGGHNPVISGFDTAIPSGVVVDIQDPYYGASTQNLTIFSTTYQGLGTWYESYLTK